MKEVVVVEPHKFEIREVPIPEPKDDQVQIKLMAAGVCGSDIHIFKGENPNSRYPLIPGHENVGVVTKVGKDCTRIQAGDHVVIDYVMRCGECSLGRCRPHRASDHRRTQHQPGPCLRGRRGLHHGRGHHRHHHCSGL